MKLPRLEGLEWLQNPNFQDLTVNLPLLEKKPP